MISLAPGTAARSAPGTLRAGWYIGIAALVWVWLLAAPLAFARPATTSTWQAYQRDFYFQYINSTRGLAQSSIALMFQDHQGFMWLVTQGGMFRFDGYTLKRYTHDPDRADSLPESYRMNALADAGNGNLWVGSATRGLLLFDPEDNRTLPLPATVHREDVAIGALLRLPDGQLLVGSTRGIDRVVPGPTPVLHSVWALPPGDATPVRHLTRCTDGAIYANAGNRLLAITRSGSTHVLATTRNAIHALLCTPKNQLLLGNGNGLARVDRATGVRTPLWPQAGRPASGVSAIALDHAGNIWLGLVDHALLRIDPHGHTVRIAPAPVGIPDGLPDSSITSLLVDHTGLLWVGTLSAGAAWTDPKGGAIQAALNLDGDPRLHGFVRGFQTAAAGQYWVASSGQGLLRYDPIAHTVTSYAAALQAATAGTSSPRAFGILRNTDGTLLLATSQGVLKFDPSTGAASYARPGGTPLKAFNRALLRTRNGDLWTSPEGEGLVHYRQGRVIQRFDEKNGLASNNVIALAEARDGKIWAGTTAGLSLIDPATATVRSFHETPGDHQSLAGRTVISLLVTRAGTLWAGSLSGLSELVHLDPHGARFQRYGLANGLPDNTIDCMLEDATGNIWFSTNLGLGRLNPKTGSIRSFGLTDGIQGDEYNSEACLATTNGTLLFGGHGFDIIHPAAMQSTAANAPIVITGVTTAAGQTPIPIPAAGAAPIQIGASDRSIHAAFAVLDYTASQRNRFRHRLLGQNPAWSAVSRAHTVAYSGLKPGSYQLQIQSVLPDGALGNQTSLAFHVANVWWWTPAMHAIYLCALALLLLIATLGWRSHYLEQLRHRRQLRLRESRLRQALWGSGDQFWDWNLAHGSMLRLGAEETPGGHHEESITADRWRKTMVHPDDLANLDHALAEHLAGRSQHFEVEHRTRVLGGGWTWVLSRGRIVERDATGKPTRICGTERNISALRTADRDRRIASEVIRNMSEAVAVTDLEYRFVSVNTAFTRMTGYSEHEVLGHDAAILNGSREGSENATQMRETTARDGHWRGELWQRRKDGEEFLCWVELNEVRDASGQRTHMIAVLTDITDRKRAEQELRYLANYDTLTGLPNRALLGERLGAAVTDARHNGHKVALLFLDLDRFKHINDSLGHTAGDHTLKAVGTRLRQYVRDNDVVARLGGDEFTVVLEDLTDVRSAEEMAQRLLTAFAKPLAVGVNQETVISPSIGIALYPDHGQTPSELLKCADTAMYHAKERGRNTWAVYHLGMDARVRNHANLITALKRALDRDELHMVYQPKLDLASGTVTGMESLLRWRHPELGNVSPSVFIPLAEETGQIHELSSYVFATACADLRRFRAAGHTSLIMAINLSAAQLSRPDLTLHICDMLAEHDVVPSQVEIELTETMVMANAEQSVKRLGELKSIGARLAIDDFGTGYSSLAYLKRLPIDTLKIDQAFVRDITTDADDAAITSTIITLAHSLQLSVVAEGVETPEQLAFLRAQHCDQIQGYWLSRPLAADAFLDFLDQRQHAPANPD